MSRNQKELPMAGSDNAAECCPDPANSGDSYLALEANWLSGQLETAAGPVWRVDTTLNRKDQVDAIKMRLGIGRMSFAVPPGLYAAGNPDDASPVIVSANYKLSFDSLRREFSGLNLWILVLDTGGINVWCAAGKGTFGTAEVVRMVEASNLSEIVSHRALILPQLAAPGVAAHEVRNQAGFKVIYGPVRAADIPGFLNAGLKARPEMRRKSFTLAERLVLAPVELVGIIKPLIGVAVILLLLNLIASFLGDGRFSLTFVLGSTISALLPFVLAVVVGTVLVPALLPYIPGRPLAWKGWLLGVLLAFAYTTVIAPGITLLETAAYYLVLPAITAFLGMNFTGSTTYTSLSGVVKEMGVALPLIMISAGLGLIGLGAAYFV